MRGESKPVMRMLDSGSSRPTSASSSTWPGATPAGAFRYSTSSRRATSASCRRSRSSTDARGVRFSTHAYWWIRQAITRAVYRQARVIRLPENIALRTGGLRDGRTEEGSEESAHDVAADASWSGSARQSGVSAAANAARLVLSLDAALADEDNLSLGELIADDEDEQPVRADARGDAPRSRD